MLADAGSIPAASTNLFPMARHRQKAPAIGAFSFSATVAARVLCGSTDGLTVSYLLHDLRDALNNLDSVLAECGSIKEALGRELAADAQG